MGSQLKTLRHNTTTSYQEDIMKQRTNLVLVLLLGGQLKQIDASNVTQHGWEETSFATSVPGWESLPLEGCPTSINVTGNGTTVVSSYGISYTGYVEGEDIIAGRIYWDKGNSLADLACNGEFIDYNPGRFGDVNVKYDSYFGSVIVNPGCTLFIFEDFNQGGSYKKYTSDTFLIKADDKFVYNLGGHHNFVKSMLWTCTQTYPSCTPSDAWHHITELDNSASSVTTEFTYEKTVGTTYSHEMKNSISISATVGYELEEGFEAGFASAKATESASLTTGYDWTSTDTATTSEATKYNVDITVPPKTKVMISEAIGKCGDSTVNTQMFKITDKDTGKETVMNGKIRKIEYNNF